MGESTDPFIRRCRRHVDEELLRLFVNGGPATRQAAKIVLMERGYTHDSIEHEKWLAFSDSGRLYIKPRGRSTWPIVH
jgi:hypothetical protein